MRALFLLMAWIAAAALLGCAGCAGGAPDSSLDAAPDVGPMSEKELARLAQWNEAVRGLDFDTGVVVVTEPTARDALVADEMMRLGEVELESNRKVEAVAAYARAVRAEPDRLDAYMGLARALQHKGRPALASSAYRTATELDPNHVAAYVGLANTLAMEGLRPQAIRVMHEAVRLDPTNGAAHERLAIWHYYEHDTQQARRHVKAAQAAGYDLPPQFLALLEEQPSR